MAVFETSAGSGLFSFSRGVGASAFSTSMRSNIPFLWAVLRTTSYQSTQSFGWMRRITTFCVDIAIAVEGLNEAVDKEEEEQRDPEGISMHSERQRGSGYVADRLRGCSSAFAGVCLEWISANWDGC